MSVEDTADQEPRADEEQAPDRAKGRPSLSRMRRELTDEELGSSGVAKILNDDVERLEREVERLRDYERRYHERDRDAAVLRERAKKSTGIEIASGGSLTTGALLAGLSPTGWSIQPLGWSLLLGGIVVLVIGIAAKVASR